jgi:hypothetical protein
MVTNAVWLLGMDLRNERILPSRDPDDTAVTGGFALQTEARLPRSGPAVDAANVAAGQPDVAPV